MKLLLENARLLSSDSLVSLWCDAGKIIGSTENGDVAPSPESFERVIDLDGRLLLPGFVNPHLHPDKSLLGDMLGHAKTTLEESIQLTWQFKAQRSPAEIGARAALAI